MESATTVQRPGRLTRRLLIAAAVFLVVVCVVLAVLWQSRIGLAERIVTDALTSRGISNASFRISMLGFKSIEVRDFAIAPGKDPDQPDLSAQRISISYRLGELLSGRVQSINVDELRINARLGDKGLSLGAADPLLQLGGGGTSAGSALPDIHVSDAAIHLVTAQGTFDAIGAANLSQADAAAPIAIELPALRLSEFASPARFEPVMLSARLIYDNGRLDFDADGRTDPAKGAGVALAKVTGHYDVAGARGSAKANGQLDFVPGKFAPKDLSSTLKNIVSDLNGRVAYRGDFSFAGSKIASSGQATLSNVDFRVGSTIVKGVAGTIRLSNLMPPQTKGVQTLSVAHVDTVVPLDNGHVKFEIGSGMAAHLVEATWPFTGGRLTLTSPAHVTNRYKLTVDKVDIEKLLLFADIPGLSGTGTLSGEFPLKIVNGDPIITNGAISSRGNGVIIYSNEAADAAANTEQTQLLSQALKNFHYTELSGAVDGNVNGNLEFRIGLQGANPSLYDGYPIHLNVNLQGSLADLIRRGTVGFRPLELIQSGVGTEKEANPK